MSYPKPSFLSCPECRSALQWDEWTHTEADHNGEPNESTGVGLYCTNRECDHHTQPVDESECDDEEPMGFSRHGVLLIDGKRIEVESVNHSYNSPC